MTEFRDDFLQNSRQAFLANRGPTLHDVRESIAADEGLDAIRRRDMLSALRSVEAHSDRVLASIPATAWAMREIFADINAAQMRISRKRFANIRSAASAAVRLYSGARPMITRRISLTADWRALIDAIEIPHVRHGLHRLAAFCSHMAIAPDEVTQETLLGLHTALNAEEIVKKPKQLIKTTLVTWNRCSREIKGWPQIRLESPFKQAPYTFPLDAFPNSFHADIAAWQARVSNPDPLDLEAPARALRPETVAARIFGIRRFASALVHRGDLAMDEITSIKILLRPDRFKSALRFFIDRVGGEPTASVHNLANAMRYIGQHWCKLGDEVLSELEALCRRLDPGTRGRQPEKNRDRLRQFDDPRAVGLFLEFPTQQVKKARKEKNPMRAAKRVERALMVSLLIHCGLRQKTLRMLEITDFTWTQSSHGSKCLLSIPGEKVKNGRPLEFELSDETADMLRLYLDSLRPELPGSESCYLFPGQNGGIRAKSSVEEAISSAFRSETGLIINPHLIRSIVGKIAVERDPAAYGAVTTLLGHSTDATTRAHYLGSETKAAGRYLDGVLRKAKSGVDRGNF